MGRLLISLTGLIEDMRLNIPSKLDLMYGAGYHDAYHEWIYALEKLMEKHSNKESVPTPMDNMRKGLALDAIPTQNLITTRPEDAGLPRDLSADNFTNYFPTQNPFKAVCAKCGQEIFYLDEHDDGCPTKTPNSERRSKD